ncbi:MAG: chalcone isomerase family protein [Acidobacteria bacterium]|nr:chalcone isomerase family protein [Acidobacteriota bacterium]MCA1609331.1 chalcone isomerase family protein [Acidobacteriota bacterium]
MKYRSSMFALLIVAAASIATAAAPAAAGVTMPDTVTVEGKTLKLNGMGLRTKVVFKVYVAGLYLETPSKDAAAILAADEVKSMRLAVLRSLKGSQVMEAIEEGFEKNSKAQMPALKPKLDRLGKIVPNVEKGDDIVLTYVPGKGTVVTAKGAEKGVIEGKDFADALFSVWLGANPIQEDLKKELLKG